MRVNELFYSLQGEGHFTGTPALFVRFAGCNLSCGFCDTDFHSFTRMTEEELLAVAAECPARHVVITGGEPTLQLTASLVDGLHDLGFFVQIETNGSLLLPDNLAETLDWITCSPKEAEVRIQRIDELKVVYTGQDMERYARLRPTHPSCRYLQPCDTGDKERNAENMKRAVDYILHHPEWKLSLQTHKILNVR